MKEPYFFAYFYAYGTYCLQEGRIVRIVNIIAYILVIVGAVNWGLFGLFNFNLVSSVFAGARTVGSVIVYTIIALSALWLILSPLISGGALWFRDRSAD